MIRNYTFWIAAILLVILGFFLKYIVDSYSSIYFCNEISLEINPLELFSIIINILLALYIANVLSPSHEKNIKEIELIVSYFLEFKKELNEKFSNISSMEQLDVQKLSSDCKTLRRKLKAYSDIVVLNNHLDSNDEYLNSLKDLMDTIWEELTDSPKNEQVLDPSKGETADSVRVALLHRVEGKIIKIEGLIFKLILKLNNNNRK